jgi:hypothetical protein
MRLYVPNPTLGRDWSDIAGREYANLIISAQRWQLVLFPITVIWFSCIIVLSFRGLAYAETALADGWGSGGYLLIGTSLLFVWYVKSHGVSRRIVDDLIRISITVDGPPNINSRNRFLDWRARNNITLYQLRDVASGSRARSNLSG